MANSKATTKSSSSDHRDEQRFVCDECGRAYKAVETLNRHRKNHSDAVSYACTSCTATFKRKDLLGRHSNIHLTSKSSTPRNRGQRACERCSRLKTRCDSLMPCARCAQNNHQCTYRDTRPRSGSLQPVESTFEGGRTNSTISSATRSSVASSSPDIHVAPSTQFSQSSMQVDIPHGAEDWQGSFGVDTSWMTDASWPNELLSPWQLEGEPHFRRAFEMEHDHAFSAAGQTTHHFQTPLEPLGLPGPAPPSIQHMHDPSWAPPPSIFTHPTTSEAPVSNAVTYRWPCHESHSTLGVGYSHIFTAPCLGSFAHNYGPE
nr:zinc finger protein 460 [Quercus suber]